MKNTIQLASPANRHILNKTFAHTNYCLKILKQYWGTLSAILLGVGSLIVSKYVAEYSYQTGLLELARQIGVLLIMGVVAVRISSALLHLFVFNVAAMPKDEVLLANLPCKNIVNDSPTYYLTLSFDGFITKINIAGAALFCAVPFELVNHHILEIISNEDKHHWYVFAKDMRMSLESEHNLKLRLLRTDNTVFYAQLNCLIVTTADNSRVIQISLTDFHSMFCA